jgi:hypothetical protein
LTVEQCGQVGVVYTVTLFVISIHLHSYFVQFSILFLSQVG